MYLRVLHQIAGFIQYIPNFPHTIDIEDGLLYDNLAWIKFAVFRQIKV